MRPWSKLPTWWFRSDSAEVVFVPDGSPFTCGTGRLAALRGGLQAGASQAALRILLALACADERRAEAYGLEASLENLEAWTGLSRLSVLRGIRRAVEHGLIIYEPGGPRRKSHFELARPETDGAGGWAKLPTAQVRQRIPRIPHRGDVGLAALKIYLTLIAARSNANTVVALRHDTLRAKTGCQTGHVRAALSLLANEGLIHVVHEEDSADARYKAQKYQICGRLDAPRRWDEATAMPPVVADS